MLAEHSMTTPSCWAPRCSQRRSLPLRTGPHRGAMSARSSATARAAC